MKEIDEIESLQDDAPKFSDDLLKMGRYSILVCIFVEIAMLSQLSNTMYMVYAACDSCHPNNMVFERQFYGIIDEFNLHCEGVRFEKLGTSIQMIGLMAGCLVFGQLSDVYGRKMLLLVCLAMCTIFGVATAFSPNFLVFTGLRTILSFFNGGQSTISVVYLIENIPKRSRMYISTLISFSPNVILLGCLAYFFQTWSSLSIVISILIIPAILILFFLHESPRYLMQKGRIDEATTIFLKIERFDKTPMGINEDELVRLLEHEHLEFGQNARKNHNFWHLLTNRRIAIGTGVIAFCFFSTTLINYANMFNLGAISGSIYLNAILIGLLRYSVSISCGFFDFKYEWFNRKFAHSLCSCLSILAIFVILILRMTETDSIFAVVMRFCVLISCSMTSQAIIVASVTSNELMPTAVRSQSYAIAQLSSRFGIVFAPHVFYLDVYFGRELHSLPYFVLLFMAIADFANFRFLIPETKNKPLEDHIASSKSIELQNR
ncbi:unnamed protein product [Caenorhabditis bovis]|uniref:Major facilitator superfamily (MFS) profile domain-containing protein n=1 Tax=Caenorhabditis bovis TaxID=2654633 RepID=A0A8S1EHA6_9PELO|nr:unnamed protein product [Caenorhabditis bovis]